MCRPIISDKSLVFKKVALIGKLEISSRNTCYEYQHKYLPVLSVFTLTVVLLLHAVFVHRDLRQDMTELIERYNQEGEQRREHLLSQITVSSRKSKTRTRDS